MDLPQKRKRPEMEEESDSFLTTHLDILFSILNLLPTEDLARAKLVCRTWYKLMYHPTFLHAHCTRDTPIAAFFTQNLDNPEIQGFKPFSDEERFPSCITGFLERSNQLVSTNHGLICVRNFNCVRNTFAVGNPATYLWACFNDDIYPSGFSFHGAALVFDPSASYHFKLAAAMIKVDASEPDRHYIRFHIYSSKTRSWTVSSVYTEIWDPEVTVINPGVREMGIYRPCKIGGGSVCWKDEFHFLVGYDISTDTYWRTPLPHVSERLYSFAMTGISGDVYYIIVAGAKGRVWRLEEKNRWILEGEARNENLHEFGPVPFAYDKARAALLVGGWRNNEVYAFHLSTAKLELIREGEGLPWEDFDTPQFSHANTLAPFFGGELTNWG